MVPLVPGAHLMPYPRTPHRPGWSRAVPWLVLGLLALRLGGAGAAPLPSDDVEEVRQALERAHNRSPRTPGYNLATTVRDLRARAKKIDSLADLGRALVLLQWGSPAKDDNLARQTAAIRREMANRFIARVKEAARESNPDRQIAVCNLVAETITSAGEPSRQASGLLDVAGPELYEALVKVASPIIQISRSKDPRVREAAARALSQFSKRPEVVPALGRMMARDDPANTVAVRRAAADAMHNMALILTGGEVLRSSEPGVMRRETRGSRALFGHEDLARIGVRIVPAATQGLSDPSPLLPPARPPPP